MDDVPVWWVIDRVTGRIVGSTHTSKLAKAMASAYEARTHHRSHTHKVMMTEISTHH